MITSILLATTILATQPKFDHEYPKGTVQLAFLGLTGESDAENAVASISSHTDVYWVDIEFDGAKSFKKQAGDGYVMLKFDDKMNFSAPAVPSKARDAIKKISFDSSGDLKVKIEYGSDYFAYISDRGKRLSVEIRKKQSAKDAEKNAEIKKESKKEEEAKKLEKKKADDKKAEDKKAAIKKEEAKKEEAKKEEAKKAEAKKLELKKAQEKKKKEKAQKAERAKKEEQQQQAQQEDEWKKQKPEPKPEPEKIKEESPKIELPQEEVQPAAISDVDVPEAAVQAPLIKEAKITFTKEDDFEQLKFDFPKIPAAAVFERFGYLWIVFDVSANPKFPLMGQSDEFASVQKLKSEFMAYKLPMKKPSEVSARVTETGWIVEVGGAQAAQKRIRSNAEGDAWIIKANHSGKAVKLFDDFTEDALIAFPVTDIASVGADQVNSDFSMGKTVQGFVIRPISDLSGAISFEPEQVKVRKSAGAIDESQKKIAQAANLLPIYPFQKWRQLSGVNFRNAETASAQAGKLENAYFLFSQGLYAEANIRLKGFDYMVPNFLRSVGNFLMGHYNEAALGFDATKLESGYDENELTMWKIAANEMLSRHNPAGVMMPADDNFVLPKNLANYPENVAAKVLLPVAEFYANSGDFKRANEVLAMVPKTASPALLNYGNYVQAKSFAAENKKARAYEVFAQVAASNTDRESRAKSSYEVIMADLDAKKITPEAAAAKLDKLLIVWRGDKFEHDLLSKLGAMYANQKQYLKALRLYKQLVTKFPSFPDTASTTEAMKGFFTQALKRGN